MVRRKFSKGVQAGSRGAGFGSGARIVGVRRRPRERSCVGFTVRCVDTEPGECDWCKVDVENTADGCKYTWDCDGNCLPDDDAPRPNPNPGPDQPEICGSPWTW